ncbi:hypothetical protein Dsin_002002 [Dipteronia sinensis]|uniref:Reverse transcriptase n=1 Tax=Dipteronia sinensis TaxID=43782 RepID=A0AAE0EIZ5_9ROSI|nr:hypothetical protein Dsin_002002 [Dipteronia sinensis]
MECRLCFFKKNWDTVGPGVTADCLKVLNDGEPLGRVNNTLVCLIPKVHVAERITDYRPISMCNVVYKIVAKALTTRLRSVLGEVISET